MLSRNTKGNNCGAAQCGRKSSLYTFSNYNYQLEITHFGKWFHNLHQPTRDNNTTIFTVQTFIPCAPAVNFFKNFQHFTKTLRDLFATFIVAEIQQMKKKSRLIISNASNCVNFIGFRFYRDVKELRVCVKPLPATSIESVTIT
jgi:hypothetical protein